MYFVVVFNKTIEEFKKCVREKTHRDIQMTKYTHPPYWIVVVVYVMTMLNSNNGRTLYNVQSLEETGTRNMLSTKSTCSICPNKNDVVAYHIAIIPVGTIDMCPFDLKNRACVEYIFARKNAPIFGNKYEKIWTTDPNTMWMQS
jgi:hypothetical protein